MGAYVSFPDFARSLPARYRLVAALCARCARVAFPPRAITVNVCTVPRPERTRSAHSAPPHDGQVARGGGPSEFAAEQAMTGDYVSAIVELEEGPRVAARLADVTPAEVRIGLPVEAVLRRIYSQQGVVRYGFKFAPRGG